MQSVYDAGSIYSAGNLLIWSIDDFFKLRPSEGLDIRSTEIPYGDNLLSLVIWPCGRKGCGSDEWFEICLHKFGEIVSSDYVRFSIRGKVGRIGTCTVGCSEYNNFWKQRFLKYSEFRANCADMAPRGCLTIICELFIEKDRRSDNKSVPRWSGIMPPMYDPPVQFQSGEYRSPDYSSGITFSSAAKSSSDKARGFNFSSPYSINSFFSVSNVENVHQCSSTSAKTQNSTEMSHDADTDRKESNKEEKFSKTQKSNSSNMSHDADRKESNKEEKPSKTQKSNSSKMSPDADRKESNKVEKSSKTQKSNSSNMSHDADRKKSNKKRKSSKTQKSNSSNMSHDADADRKESNKKQKSSETKKSHSKMPSDINADISESTLNKTQMSNIKMPYNAENASRDTNNFSENPNSPDVVSSTNEFADAAASLPHLSGETSNSAASSSKARNLKEAGLKKETIQSVIDVLRSEKNNFRSIEQGQLLYALGYLQSHMKDIITTEEWQKFLNEDTCQAVDFLIQAARLPSGNVPYSKTWM